MNTCTTLGLGIKAVCVPDSRPELSSILECLVRFCVVKFGFTAFSLSRRVQFAMECDVRPTVM
jgi:hypothetical protein